MMHDYPQNLLISPIGDISKGGTEELSELLKDLNKNCKDIQLSMVSTKDGLTITACGSVINPDQVGAMCTELITVCHKAAEQLERGELDQMLLRCSNGCLFLMSAGSHAVLAVMTVPDVNLGLLIIESQRIATLIQKLL